MLSINFAALIAEKPELAHAWKLLDEWLCAHEDVGTISPSAIAQFARSRQSFSWDDALLLAQALDELSNRGLLRRRFAVQAPSGQLLYPYYSSRSAIPKRVRGQAEEWFNVEDAEIRPVFVGTSDED